MPDHVFWGWGSVTPGRGARKGNHVFPHWGLGEKGRRVDVQSHFSHFHLLELGGTQPTLVPAHVFFFLCFFFWGVFFLPCVL